MPDTPSLVLVKAFTYRGKDEEFSNRYHFEGGTPEDFDDWLQLAKTWRDLERKIMPPEVRWVRAYGYEAGTEHSIAQIDFEVVDQVVAGQFIAANYALVCPGDTAATIRWDTGEVNSRGKRVYCRKYFHGVFRDDSSADKVSDEQVAAMVIYADQMTAAVPLLGRRYCGPQGADLHQPRVDPWLTTRTLKRRGKRPLQ